MWKPIETAPKEPFDIDATLPQFRLRQGPMIILRGASEGEVHETRACWAITDDESGYWWDLESEEPVDWPISEWRDLTAEERAAAEAEE